MLHKVTFPFTVCLAKGNHINALIDWWTNKESEHVVDSWLQSQLPKGSVTLAVSASGSTVYMEPEPVVTLNNAEAMLRGQEQEEEQAILAGLSQMVRPVWISPCFVKSASAGCTEHDHALAVLTYEWPHRGSLHG